MLQQTGVTTVIPYFERWMDRFPTVEALARADEQAVLALWQGLGYYRRCRNLLAGARFVAEHGWPSSAADWLAVPGVGRYTAGAIASIALGEPSPLVDGNVERVYSRVTLDRSTGDVLKRQAWHWAEAQMRASAPGEWNQALMELGATVCTPKRPICTECPIVSACLAVAAGVQADLPTSFEKRQTVAVAYDVAVVIHQGRFGLRQIPPGEWWEGMWEFPRFDRGRTDLIGIQLPPLKHVVTHHRITLYPVIVSEPPSGIDLQFFQASELADVPLPAPQRRILRQVRTALAAPALDLR